MTFYDLLKLKDEEVKNFLDKNKYPDKPGALYIEKRGFLIIKIITSDYEYLWVKDRSKNQNFKGYRSNYLFLTYEVFKAKKEEYIRDTSNLFKSSKDYINFFKKILSKYFPEDRFEVVSPYSYTSSYFNVTIHYPELVIKNSLDSEHLITDLYVTFYFCAGSSLLKLETIKLSRGSETPKEIINNYIHSHYNSSMCFGDTDMDTLYRSARNKINPLDFYYFITSFHNYLQWESLEGVPFKRINELKSYAIERIEHNTFTDTIIDTIYNKTVSALTGFEYSFNFHTENAFEITLNKDKIEKTVIEQISSFYLEDFIEENKMLGYEDPSSGAFGSLVFINKEYLEKEKIRIPKTAIFFKGENVPFKLREENNENIKGALVKKVNPFLLKKIINKLEERFLDFYIKKELDETARKRR